MIFQTTVHKTDDSSSSNTLALSHLSLLFHMNTNTLTLNENESSMHEDTFARRHFCTRVKQYKNYEKNKIKQSKNY